jgi:hypothetical protein
MARKIATALLLAAILGASTGCLAGPYKLSRSWDDKTNELYHRNAWLHGAVFGQIIPIYPIVGFFAGLGDILFINPCYFWGTDAWSNTGTAFIHADPLLAPSPESSIHSLVKDQSEKP